MGGSVREITVVIPCREDESPETTLFSLAQQTFQDFKVVIVRDKGLGANWARNQGFKSVDTEFVLFSDNDIVWLSRALETMLNVLKRSKASYCYGRYRLGQDYWGHQPWDAERLKHENYVSTMSLIRSKDFPGFDENISRLQDWDLWLTMLEQGKRGVYCNDLLFTTEVRPGITYGPNLDPLEGYGEARDRVKRKHGLPITIV